MSARGIMRVTNHPRKDDWLVLKFGPDLNSLIHSFEPARQALDLGGYVMHRDRLDSLENWARYNSVQLMLEVRGQGEPTKPVECANVIDPATREVCCAPYPPSRVPAYCGACGQKANPVTHDAATPDVGVKCSCGRVNHGGPAFCLACGLPLPERHLSAPAIRRTKGEPRPLAEAVAELEHRLSPPATASHEEESR